MKKAILIVSFGTTYPDTRQKNIAAITRQVRALYPDAVVEEAVSSTIVRNAMKKREHIEAKSPTEALESMKKQGVTHVAVFPTHVIDGIENHRLKEAAKKYAGAFEQIAVADALLAKPQDYEDVAKALWESLKEEVGDFPLILMGHGTEHAADASYAMMEQSLRAYAKHEIYIATVEGSITIEDVIARIQATARAVAQIDVFVSLALVAGQNNYCKPKINESGVIDIKGGRHPVVEKMIVNDMFIDNDTYLDNHNNRISIITGPNMAGKSTYMRQSALIVLMAQIGSFVPAESANIGIVDRIFTRVGASDDLASGQSTFMVEMNEVANILRNATANSLLILDEIGRGTSTFDGLSIAWAVVEYISNPKLLGAKTLFATHYHELTELEGKLNSVNNYCIAVKEKGDDIVFLRKIVKGGADKSYGIQVAKLAGIPELVINRAKDIVNQLSANDITETVKNISVEGQASGKKKKPHLDEVDLTQMSLFDTVKDDDIIQELRDVDISHMTPMDALNKLYELQNKVKNRW